MKNKQAITLLCHPELVSGSSCFIKGFTLIELLVVVLIIAILAAVALPQYQWAVRKSRATQAIEIIVTMRQALDIWMLEKGLPSSSTVYFTGRMATESLPIEVPFTGKLERESIVGDFLTEASCDSEGCYIYVHKYNGKEESYWTANDYYVLNNVFTKSRGSWMPSIRCGTYDFNTNYIGEELCSKLKL